MLSKDNIPWSYFIDLEDDLYYDYESKPCEDLDVFSDISEFSDYQEYVKLMVI